MRVVHEEAMTLLEKWQPLLRMSDWDLSLQLKGSDWHKSGDIQVRPEYASGKVLVREELTDVSLDTVIVHELVHIKLYALDQMIEELLDLVYGEDDEDPRRRFAYGQFMMVLERTTEDLTRALLEAERTSDSVEGG